MMPGYDRLYPYHCRAGTESNLLERQSQNPRFDAHKHTHTRTHQFNTCNMLASSVPTQQQQIACLCFNSVDKLMGDGGTRAFRLCIGTKSLIVAVCRIEKPTSDQLFIYHYYTSDAMTLMMYCVRSSCTLTARAENCNASLGNREGPTFQTTR